MLTVALTPHCLCRFVPDMCKSVTSIADPTSGAEKEWEDFLIAEIDKLLTSGLTKFTHVRHSRAVLSRTC